MLPYILIAVGGYLIYKSKDSETFAKGGQIGDAARVIATNKTGVIMEKVDNKYYLLKFVNGEEGIFQKSELEFIKQYGKGGATFDDKVDAISKRLEGTDVPKRLKKDYGAKYDKEEAQEAGRRIAGSIVKKKKFDEGGESDSVAMTILNQLGGTGRLVAMTGAYNFRDIGNGVSFKIKNQKANYIKIKLNSMDLYDIEIGRVRGNTYKIVGEMNGAYADQMKPFIEKTTGMYLSLGRYGKGGLVEFDEKNEDVIITIDRVNYSSAIVDVDYIYEDDMEMKYVFYYEVESDCENWYLDKITCDGKKLSKEETKEIEKNKKLMGMIDEKISDALDDYVANYEDEPDYED